MVSKNVMALGQLDPPPPQKKLAFPTKDMKTPLSFDPTFMKDAQCAESNEK